MKIHIIYLTFLLALIFPLQAQENKPTQARTAITLIQSKDYPAAIKILNGNLKTIASDDKNFTEDQLTYLKAHALFLNKNYPEAETSADALIANFPNSKWLHKAAFLKAHTHIERRDYQKALKIYQAQTKRLFATERKNEVASELIKFADAFAKKPAKTDLEAPAPDYTKAYKLYKEVLDVDCSQQLQEQAHYRMILMASQILNFKLVTTDSLTYLDKFDPTWLGKISSLTRLTDQPNTSAKHTGKHRAQVRFRLAEALYRQDKKEQSVHYLTELLDLIDSEKIQTTPSIKAESAWLKLMAEKSLKPKEFPTLAQNFLIAYPTHLQANRTQFYIPEHLTSHGKQREAITAYQDFIDNKFNIQIIENPLTLSQKSDFANLQKRKEIAAKRKEAASYRIANLYLALNEFDKARTAYQKTSTDYPNGTHWADAQKALVNVDFQQALHSIRQIHKNEDEAQARQKAITALENFLTKHPLDQNIPHAHFLLGRIYQQNAIDLAEESQTPNELNPEQRTLFQKAISTWQEIIAKYPENNYTQRAQLLTGIIYEEHLANLEEALEIYSASENPTAKQRRAILTSKRLIASSDKTFRTDEAPHLTLNTRNIEKVTIRQFWLDLDSYFLKDRNLLDVGSLDVDLVEPDKTWEVKIENYKKHLPITSQIPVPFDNRNSGVCVLKIEGEDFVTTTLVIRSNIDIAARSSRDELIVLATNWKNGNKPAPNVKLVIADGSKVIANGTTGSDGTFKYTDKNLKPVDNLRILALAPDGAATCRMNLAGLVSSPKPRSRAWFNTARASYRPGETVHLTAIIRAPKNGTYITPPENQRTYNLIVREEKSSKLIHSSKVTLDEHGALRTEIKIPSNFSGKSVTLQLDSEHNSFFSKIAINRTAPPKAILALTFKKPWVDRNETITGNLSATYHWGTPIAERNIEVTLPNGLKHTVTTDKSGKATFTYNPSNHPSGNVLQFTANIPSEQANPTIGLVQIDPLGFNISAELSHAYANTNDPLEIKIKTTTPDGKPSQQNLTIEILERTVQKPDPILPSTNPDLTIEKSIQKITLTTDEKTGEATQPITIEKGGSFIIRITGTDKKSRTIISEAPITVYSKDSDHKLYILADKNKIHHGHTATIPIHSNLPEPALSLVTIEADKILEHRVITLNPGKNDISLDTTYRHAPTFRISVIALHDRQFYSTNDILPVQRNLNLTAEIQNLPEDKILPQDSPLTILLKATDGLDKSIPAQILLAIIDNREPLSALQYSPFNRPATLPSFVMGTSCGFKHQGTQENVIAAIRDENDRQQIAQNRTNRRNLINPTLTYSNAQQVEQVRKSLYRAEGYFNLGQYDKSTAEYKKVLSIDRYNRAARRGLEKVNSVQSDYYRAAYDHTRSEMLRQVDQAWEMQVPQGNARNGNGGFANIATGGLRSGDFAINRDSIDSFLNNPNGQTNYVFYTLDESQKVNLNGRSFGRSFNYPTEYEAPELPNQVGQDQAQLLPNISPTPFPRTPALPSSSMAQIITSTRPFIPATHTHHAEIISLTTEQKTTLPLPKQSGTYNLLATAYTTDGRITRSVETFKTQAPYTLTLDTPLIPIAGDKMSPIITLSRTNADQEESIPVTLTAIAKDKEITKTNHTFTLKKGDLTAHFTPDPITVPDAPHIDLELNYTDKELPGQKAFLAIRPAGAPTADHATTNIKPGKTNLTLELPETATPHSLRLKLSPSTDQYLYQLATGLREPIYGWNIPCRPDQPAGKLLAVASLLKLHRDQNLDTDQTKSLTDQSRALTYQLILRQNSAGAWPAIPNRSGNDLTQTAIAYEALNLAKSLNLPVEKRNIELTLAHLLKQQTSLGTQQYDSRALVQYALSTSDNADFSTCNRLFRERGKLGDTGKTHLALAFLTLKRPDFADTLLKALNPPEKWTTNGDPKLGETSIIAARALQAKLSINIKPDLTATKPLYDLTLSSAGSIGYTSDTTRGISLTALAKYAATQQKIQSDANITINLNGKEIQKIKATNKSLTITIPAKDLKPKNNLTFTTEGKANLYAAATLQGFIEKPKPSKKENLIYVTDRNYYHQNLSFKGKTLRAQSSSIVTAAIKGEQVRVRLLLRNWDKSTPEVTLIERIPAGFTYLKGSLKASHSGAKIIDNHLVVTFTGGFQPRYLSYTIIAKHPGTWNQPPAILTNPNNPAQAVYSTSSTINILPLGKTSPDQYKMNNSEHLELAQLNYASGNKDEARKHLLAFKKLHPNATSAQVAEMLLWIETERQNPDPKILADSFEILNEQKPDLVIPFEKILIIAQAYSDLKEHERAVDVYTATIEAGFAKDAYVGVALEDQDRFLDSVDYQLALWQQYPSQGEITNAYFNLAQIIYQKSTKAENLTPRQNEKEAPTEPDLIQESLTLLDNFVTLNPEHPLADDTAFTQANALFSLKAYDQVVAHAKTAQARYPKSDFASSFRYMEAVGNFWLRNYQAALTAATEVAKGNSKDKNLATYITAQIYHAKGQPIDAMKWYESIKNQYPDARESIAYFEQKKVQLDEVKILKSGEKPTIKLTYRNIKQANLQIYRVDLMKLYLREKSLSNISKVNLAGINPHKELTIELGDGNDFQDKEKTIDLPVSADGAYLIICRGDYLYTTGLTLITPLKLEVQENPAARSVRVNITDRTNGKYLDGVHVKAIGTNDNAFKSGETDLRGIWKAENLTGTPTVIARDQKGRYAFHRGKQTFTPTPTRQPSIKGKKPDFNQNLNRKQETIYTGNSIKYNEFRRTKGKGVEIKKARKK